MNKRLFSSFVILLCLGNITNSQQKRTIENEISLNYLQIKEGMNHGLIFRGPGSGYDFSVRWENNTRIIEYSARFAFSYLESRKIGGGNINFMPLNLTYLFKPKAESQFTIGPQLIADYNYELYPDLQSGYSFWFTNFSVGAASQYKFNVNQNLFRLSFGLTFYGFTSRPQEYDNPYFFDSSFGYAIRFINQDLKSGSLNRYNHTEFEFRWQPKSESRIAIAYNLQYYGYFKEPEIMMINQMFKLVLLPGMSKK